MPGFFAADVATTTAYAPLIAATSYSGFGPTANSVVGGTVDDVSVPVIGTKGLNFEGNIRADTTNTANVFIQNSDYPAYSAQLAPGEQYLIGACDLSKIVVKCSASAKVKLIGILVS